ncbi:MAG TPA: hypothetical protein ENI67_02730 [Gammaproteobacteria bacterium]|nr:hypothetical protein [Gammaproteobacteria bacterium]
MMDYERYSTLVESIYDAALNPELWAPAVANLKDEFNSIAAGFFIQTVDQKLDGYFFEGLDPEQMHIYGEHFAENNLWFPILGLMKPGRVLTDLSLEKSHNKNTFLKSEMCQDGRLKQDFRHAMGGSLVDRQGNLLNFTFFRSKKAGHYTDAEVSKYRSLYRHLLKAIEINSHIECIENRSIVNETTLDKLRLGVAFLDAKGRVVFLNDYFQKLLKKKSSGIQVNKCHLKASHRHNMALLDMAIRNALAAGKSSTIALERPLQSALSVNVIPSTSRRWLMDKKQITLTVFITDPDDRDMTNTEYLVSRWNLSPLEARFACYLLQGHTIRKISELMELTINTAQWYSKQIMQKLEVNRQSELIIKLMNDLFSFLMAE